MSDLSQRLERVMLSAGFDPNPAAGMRRRFARYCGLGKDSPEGKDSETLISNILAGRRPGIEDETARKIARKTGFSWWWLKTGEGAERPYEGDGAPPRAVSAASPGRSLEVAVEYWPGRWSEAAIAAARALRLELSPQQWSERLDAIDGALRNVTGTGEQPITADMIAASEERLAEADEADKAAPQPARRKARRAR